MNDCSNCAKSIEVTPTAHVCSTDGKKYVISNYPAQGENCSALEPITNRSKATVKNKDPLIGFFKRIKQPSMDDAERKILEAYERNMGVKTTSYSPLPTQFHQEESSVGNEINFKYASGWIVAAVFGGVLISIWLLELIK